MSAQADSVITEADIQRWKSLADGLGLNGQAVQQFLPFQLAVLVEIRDSLHRIEVLLADKSCPDTSIPRYG